LFISELDALHVFVTSVIKLFYYVDDDEKGFGLPISIAANPEQTQDAAMHEEDGICRC